MEKRLKSYQRWNELIWLALVAIAVGLAWLAGREPIIYLLFAFIAIAISALVEGVMTTLEKKHHKRANPAYYEVGVIAVSPSGKHRVGTDLWLQNDEDELLTVTAQVNDDDWVEVPMSMVVLFICPIKGSVVGLTCFTSDDIQGIVDNDGSVYRWFVSRVKKLIPGSGPVDWQKIADSLTEEQPGYSVRVGPRTY